MNLGLTEAIPSTGTTFPLILTAKPLKRCGMICLGSKWRMEDLLTQLLQRIANKRMTGSGSVRTRISLVVSAMVSALDCFDREARHEIIDALQEKAEAFGYFELYVRDDKQI